MISIQPDTFARRTKASLYLCVCSVCQSSHHQNPSINLILRSFNSILKALAGKKPDLSIRKWENKKLSDIYISYFFECEWQMYITNFFRDMKAVTEKEGPVSSLKDSNPNNDSFIIHQPAFCHKRQKQIYTQKLSFFPQSALV